MPRERLRPHREALDEVFVGDSDEARRAARELRGQEEAAIPALAEASGIDNEPLLQRIAGFGIRADTLAALTLVPLIEIAWADDVMDPREREAILDGAVSTGIGEGSASYTLLRLWMDERPSPDMFKVWREFVAALCAELGPDEVQHFAEKLFSRSKGVAEAAGSPFDFGNNISRVEAAVLKQLDETFQPVS